MSRSEVAVAYRASSVAEAQLIVGMLEANGIASALSADDAGGFDPQLQLTDGVRILVASGDVEHAQALIAEAGDSPDPS